MLLCQVSIDKEKEETGVEELDKILTVLNFLPSLKPYLLPNSSTPVSSFSLSMLTWHKSILQVSSPDTSMELTMTTAQNGILMLDKRSSRP
jgi:hypothetical protein